MARKISKRLLYAFALSLGCSLLLSLFISSSEKGNEANQVVAIVAAVSILLCIINFVLSMPAYLNLIKSIRDNYFSSACSFLCLPIAGLISLLLTIVFKSHTTRVEAWDTSIIVAPSLIYVVALIFHFGKFRKELQQPEKL